MAASSSVVRVSWVQVFTERTTHRPLPELTNLQSVRLACKAGALRRASDDLSVLRPLTPTKANRKLSHFNSVFATAITGNETSDSSCSEEEGRDDSSKNTYVKVQCGSLRTLVVKSLKSLHIACNEQLELLGNAPDEDVIHDLRVALRRLRSTTDAFDPFLDLPKSLGRPSISKLLRILGALRDADVMKETLGKLKKKAGNLSEKEIQMLDSSHKAIHSTRANAFAAASKMLRGKQTSQILRSLEMWLESPQFQHEVQELVDARADLAVPSLLTPQVAALLLHPAWHIHHIDYKNPPAEGRMKHLEDAVMKMRPSARMHDLRKYLRELRYRMELVQELYREGGKFSLALAKVRRLQTLLGDLQDMQVLALFLLPLTKKRAPGLAKALADIQEQIWSDWLAERHTIGSLNSHKELYKALLGTQSRSFPDVGIPSNGSARQSLESADKPDLKAGPSRGRKGPKGFRPRSAETKMSGDQSATLGIDDAPNGTALSQPEHKMAHCGEAPPKKRD